jgi:hypothetical protein
VLTFDLHIYATEDLLVGVSVCRSLYPFCFVLFCFSTQCYIALLCILEKKCGILYILMVI